MNPLINQQRKTQEKIRLDILSLIQHYKPEHCLVGTLTLRGHYSLPKVNKMWSAFVRKIRAHVTAYYAVVDISKTPHIHYVMVVEKNVQESIDMEVQNRRKEGRVIPSELAMAKGLLPSLRGGDALRRYKALVRAYKQQAGFAPFMDLWPIYTIPEAVAAYHAKAHANSSRYKRTKPALKKHKIVHTSRGLPGHPSFLGRIHPSDQVRRPIPQCIDTYGHGLRGEGRGPRYPIAYRRRQEDAGAYPNSSPSSQQDTGRSPALGAVREDVMELCPGMVVAEAPQNAREVPAAFLPVRAISRSARGLSGSVTA